jgi:hypothetical protein
MEGSGGKEKEGEETFLDSAAFGRFLRNQPDTFSSVFRDGGTLRKAAR